MRWKPPKVRIASLMSVILVGSVAFASLRYASAAWSAVVLMATVGLLAWAILAAVYRRGPTRAFWLGFALFGGCYLAMTAWEWWPDRSSGPAWPTSRLTSAAYTYSQAWKLGRHGYLKGPASDFASGDGTGGVKPKTRVDLFIDELLEDPDVYNRKIREALDNPVSMPFTSETALEDVVKYIKTATSAPGMMQGIPIYVDPVGLSEAEKTMASPITLTLEGVPLRTSLSLLLKQLDLVYHIQGGVLMITSSTSRDYSGRPVLEPDAVQRIGHFWWAWITGMIGGCAALHLHSTSIPRPRDGSAV